MKEVIDRIKFALAFFSDFKKNFRHSSSQNISKQNWNNMLFVVFLKLLKSCLEDRAFIVTSDKRISCKRNCQLVSYAGVSFATIAFLDQLLPDQLTYSQKKKKLKWCLLSSDHVCKKRQIQQCPLSIL